MKEGSQKAARYFLEVLRRRILTAIKARWLLNIVHQTLGTYPDGVPKPYLIPPKVFESDEPFPRFANVAPQVGLNTFDLAGGAIAEDFDGDGFHDMMVSTMNTSGQLRYFHNDGNGRFTERT
jgi:hypothetical protein